MQPVCCCCVRGGGGTARLLLRHGGKHGPCWALSSPRRYSPHLLVVECLQVGLGWAPVCESAVKTPLLAGDTEACIPAHTAGQHECLLLRWLKSSCYDCLSLTQAIVLHDWPVHGGGLPCDGGHVALRDRQLDGGLYELAHVAYAHHRLHCGGKRGLRPCHREGLQQGRWVMCLLAGSGTTKGCKDCSNT